MKLSNTLLATVTTLALAGPAFAQTTIATSRQTDVTMAESAACVIRGTLSPFRVTSLGGVLTVPGTQDVIVDCNTPLARISIGSDDMVNDGDIASSETGLFTDTITFRGEAKEAGNSFFLSSRIGVGASSSDIGNGENRRIRTLKVGVAIPTAKDNKRLIAGAYTGEICIFVDPGATLTGYDFENAKCGGGDGAEVSER